MTPTFPGKAQRIKSVINVGSYIRTHGYKPVPSGPRFMTLHCPVCQRDLFLSGDTAAGERKMWMSADGNICGCFGSKCKCNTEYHGFPLDIINLYSLIHEISLTDAIREMYLKFFSGIEGGY